MALPAVLGNSIYASDLYQLSQPTGNTEKVGYYLDGWGNASGDKIGGWFASQSRLTTPVSISLDTSVGGPTSCNSPSSNSLSAYGVHVFTTTTGAVTSAFVAGFATIQY